MKQSAKNWNQCLDEALKSLGFKSSIADNCLYIKGAGDKREMCLAFVDDILYATNSCDQIKGFAKKLRKKFKLKDLRAIRNYLSTEIQKISDSSFLLRQKSKIIQLLEKFHMQDCKSVRTPIEVKFLKTCLSGEDPSFENQDLYHSAIRSLMYLSQ